MDNFYPLDENNITDINAATDKMFEIEHQNPRAWINHVNWWLDPVIKGHYPLEGKGEYDSLLPKNYEKRYKKTLLKQLILYALICTSEHPSPPIKMELQLWLN